VSESSGDNTPKIEIRIGCMGDVYIRFEDLGPTIAMQHI
jgi:hypothetical protein